MGTVVRKTQTILENMHVARKKREILRNKYDYMWMILNETIIMFSKLYKF